MGLRTSHIGWAIKDAMEGKVIKGDPANRNNPFAEEDYTVLYVDSRDSNNPLIVTDGGTFKAILLRVEDAEGDFQSMKDVTPKRKQIEGTNFTRPLKDTPDAQ